MIKGYRDATDKKKGLGVEYSMLAMEEMAKFHALGHAYVHSFKGGVEEALKAQEVLATDYFCAKPDPEFKKILDSFIGENLKQMIMLIECFQEPGQNLVDQFKSFHEKNGIFALRDQLYTPSESGFNTLCHGDTWFNNMLFQ